MILPRLEMSTSFMDGLFSEDKYWVTSTDYELMMAKSLILCGPSQNPNPNSIWDVDIKAQLFCKK